MSTELLDKEIKSTNTGFIAYFAGGRKALVEIGDILTIGREPPSHIQLNDRFVSSRHARIERAENGFTLRDLQSRNGTFVNGAKVIQARLSDGDRIRIGETQLRFSVTRETTASGLPLESQNADWQATLQRLPSMAESELAVLITGPSGAGKELVATSLHRHSPRARGPLVSVNCSALSESLIESELFGHVRGSFTGASHDRLGAFCAANGGTLFLDEIGDLPLSLQPKLLRALENSEVRPVGSDRTISTNVRVVAATHHDLQVLVRQGRFRQDLFFRLNVIRVQIPPLVRRLEDFESLLYHFAKLYRVRYSTAAILLLKQHSWPGNIRELRNLVARTRAYFPGELIEPRHINELIDPDVPALPPAVHPGERPLLKDIEAHLIQERLIYHHGNQRKVAADLGMPKSTLHDRIKTYGINIETLVQSRR